MTFNNHEGSTKSYTHQKEHGVTYHDPFFIAPKEQIDIEYDEGELQEVVLHDGSKLVLRKLETDHNPAKINSSRKALQETRDRGEILTGLIHVDTEQPSLTDATGITKEPLVQQEQGDLRPATGVLSSLNDSFRI